MSEPSRGHLLARIVALVDWGRLPTVWLCVAGTEIRIQRLDEPDHRLLLRYGHVGPQWGGLAAWTFDAYTPEHRFGLLDGADLAKLLRDAGIPTAVNRRWGDGAAARAAARRTP